MTMADNTPVLAERPLNATQLKNLEKIVQGDFQDLADSIRMEIDQKLASRLREIEDRFSDLGGLDAARQEVIDLARQHQDTMRAEVQALRDKHPTLLIPDNVLSSGYNPDAIKQNGKQEAISRARAAADRLRQHAYLIMNREQRKTQRIILLQGVTPGAANDILTDMPEADDILGIVQAEMGVSAAEDIKELTGQAPIVPAIDAG